ncbi:hypothetical protein VN97_g12904 [Penicillium thymicola]|uniref:Uncharacterized protein n=1 Tax=Penicillium thymicola TaxID=293382 RepID=A0AAI9T4N5_PENTH|nr:hypothetical protein VN97_g12904 [Penicillium thymicola]
MEQQEANEASPPGPGMPGESIIQPRPLSIAVRAVSTPGYITYLIYLYPFMVNIGTYDHRVWKIGLPVRSAVLKPHAGELVVGWVTTSESSLLYVFCFCSI